MHTVSSSYVIEHEVADTLSGKFETFGFVAALLLDLLLFILVERTRLNLNFLIMASKKRASYYLSKSFVNAIKFVSIATFSEFCDSLILDFS